MATAANASDNDRVTGFANASSLRAGAAKVDITDVEAGPVNDPLYVKALVIGDDAATVVLITVDAVAIAEIGRIRNEYLANVRARLHKELGVDPASVLINVSHCHGVVCADVEQCTVQAVKEAWGRREPVTVGAGVGHEDRIMENRRLKLTSGAEADVRHAYSLPADEAVDSVGPVDPEIGVLRLDRADGSVLAVVFNFACHPILGVPSKGNTADISGFACQAIENSLGRGATALFLQGCAGDINPVGYKAVDHPRDAEPLGNRLGLSVLRSLTEIETRAGAELVLVHETLGLPRADLAPRIAALEARRRDVLGSLRGTSLDLKTFIPLIVKYGLSARFPSYASHAYLHDKAIGRDDFEQLDAENRANIEQYVSNILAMEELTRIQANLSLLEMHQARDLSEGTGAIDVEVVGLRIGDFVLVTFPGELSVRIGLGVKQRSPHQRTFVAAYTNGYIYYAPTAEQLANPGAAQEDTDCELAPEWQKLYEDRVAELLEKL